MSNLQLDRQEANADLTLIQRTQAREPFADALRKHLGIDQVELRRQANGAVWERGTAPAFSIEGGKMAVRDWDTGELLAKFQGIAYDYVEKRFVLLGLDRGERSINYLHSTGFPTAELEAKMLCKRLEIAS